MKSVRGESVSGAATLMVFCIFAMLVFSMILLGAGAYKNIVEASRGGSEERLCLSYVWTTVKNNDNGEGVFVGMFNDSPALYVAEEYGESVYYTIIYHHEGWVCELFAENVYEATPDYGARITQAQSLEFEQLADGNIIVKSGETSVFICPRGSISGSWRAER